MCLSRQQKQKLMHAELCQYRKIPEISPIMDLLSATPVSYVVSGPGASYNLKRFTQSSCQTASREFSCLVQPAIAVFPDVAAQRVLQSDTPPTNLLLGISVFKRPTSVVLMPRDEARTSAGKASSACVTT